MDKPIHNLLDLVLSFRRPCIRTAMRGF